ncbi:DUF456 domain-containing protein [Lentibacillus salicampi]|uniref:DUF456 family protein n=1 Tax=Lentibacillus salicampi TaxID=175306 RepID=A0A4Y9A895_9BACI|nr:DUF456 family protein [Lentibacillus salicampi]TFJ91452.1 DUF456 family protein [Lentibacillus salicampi]
MLEIIVWIIIIALFIASFAGVIFPIIPSPLVLWVGFLLYHFVLNAEELTWFFWVAMAVLTVILIVSDIIANSYFVKKYGGSKWGERGAAIAVIIGSFIIPPFGILIIPFVAVLVIELMQERTLQEAIRASIGSLIGFLGGAAAKVVIQLAMIVWFFIVIIF